MKKILITLTALLCIYTGIAQQLRGVTFGVGMGWSHLNEAPKDFYLSTDELHILQQQDLNKSSVVVSSTISIKLGKLGTDTDTDGKKVLVNMNKIDIKTSKPEKADFIHRLAVNISLNLAEINSGDISFNKSIDGGIGLGCYINSFTQIALFYDMIRVRQLRDKIVEQYLGNSIPNGAEVYNALDQSNNNLFYNKYFSGYSIKVVFSLGN